MQDKVNYISPETFEKIVDYIPILGIRKWKDEDIKMLYKTMYYCALLILNMLILINIFIKTITVKFNNV